jgi:hypothetical protein
MADFENTTPFSGKVMPSMDRDGVDLLLVVVAAQFVLPEPGEDARLLRLSPIQEPPPMADEYVGEPGHSSVRREGQSPYTKPATDVYVCADACAPNGRPVTEMNVSIRIGPCAIDMRVHGDRLWQRSLTLGARPSDAAPFVKMPLVWERAYGGMATNSTEERPVFEPRNPIGCGFEHNTDDAIGRPLPNIEDPRHPLTRISDRPRPLGVGPVARHWQPRVGYSGTYDEAWKRQRAPLWPADLDERFFCGAPEYLQASPHLIGGEQVQLQGLHPAGAITFRLPALRLASRSRFIGRTVDSTPTLDGVLIETNAGRLTMYYRAAVPAPLSLIKHRETSLHLLRPGEVGIPQ